MSSTRCTSAERLSDKGFGVLLHRLVQTLLSLKVRPANPIEWLLRKLKDNDFYCDERGLALFLSNAITTAANRSERSAPAPTSSNPSASRRSSLLSQLMVSVLCDFSIHYRELHDGRLMAEETLLNLSRMLADFLMWEEISHQSIESRLNPIQQRSHMLLSQYVLYGGNALKMAEQLRQYCLPRKQVQADLTVVDAIFDLTEVLLKLRCFAAQSEIDALGDEVVQFPPSLGCADDDVDLGLSIASKRPFRLVFILPFAASQDGLVPCSQLTSAEVLERLFSLVERFASSGGFPNTIIRCIATGLPTNVRNSQPLMNHLQIKSVEPEDSEILRSALQPLEFLSEYVAQNHSRFVTAENVSVIPPHFAVASQFNGTSRPPSVPLDSCKCKSRLCRTLCTYCAWDGSMESKGDRLANVAPPCGVLLPIPGTTVVLSTPTIVVVGMCIAEHLAKAMFSSVPTFQPASATIASSPAAAASAAAAEAEKKKKGKTDKGDGGKQAPPPPPTAASGGPPAVAPPPEDAPTALSPQQARRVAFGPAFDILFEGLEAPPDQQPPADSFFVVALKPLAGVKKSKTQTVAATLLSLALSDCLKIHIGTAKPILNYSLPFVGAVSFSWSAALERHASENCWWAECLFETCLPFYNTVIPDAPLAKCCLVLRSAFNAQPTLKYATALVDQYKTLSTVVKTENDSSQDQKKVQLPSQVHAPLLPFTSIVSCFVLPAMAAPAAEEGKPADGKGSKASVPPAAQSPTAQGTSQQKASAIWSQTRQLLDAKYTAAKAKNQLSALNDALFNILSLVKDDHTLIEICTAISKLQ